MKNTNQTVIEYSKDLNFFLEHQISVSFKNSRKHVTFFSRLNGERFHITDGGMEWKDEMVVKKCREIHKEILKNTEKYLVF